MSTPVQRKAVCARRRRSFLLPHVDIVWLVYIQRTPNEFAAHDGDTTDGQGPVIRGIATGRSGLRFVNMRTDLPGAEYLATELCSPGGAPVGLGLNVIRQYPAGTDYVNTCKGKNSAGRTPLADEKDESQAGTQ